MMEYHLFVLYNLTIRYLLYVSHGIAPSAKRTIFLKMSLGVSEMYSTQLLKSGGSENITIGATSAVP